ncbi:sulfite exporter TauE/SafE family protein [Shewanella acanthi]|uniref:sulfite exporter TauE/SafE family protein n=1 Tax=Shewanella acanthi TaxID=2864212 RepID=UPI001C65BBDC|nr:sulfite exporter TauE/SafE family protein [Shewanella acanthi]QYJ80573.1 sulfite exporter TauE/SafE family protein [Shewanella acanthi]
MDNLIIVIAGLFAGMLNAIAGGGSFITLFALVFVGLPPLTANATGTAALLPGYLASAWRFRKDMVYPANLNLKQLCLIAIAGGCIGAGLLLSTSVTLFSHLVPWLILLATAAFALLPWWFKRRVTVSVSKVDTTALSPINSVIVLAIVCIYGGYFNGGLGIILLAALGLIGQSQLHGMNGIKNLLSAILSLIAVLIYAFGGLIDGQHLFLLTIMGMTGGYLGAALSYRVSQTLLRRFIIIAGLLMAVGFLLIKP